MTPLQYRDTKAQMLQLCAYIEDLYISPSLTDLKTIRDKATQVRLRIINEENGG